MRVLVRGLSTFASTHSAMNLHLCRAHVAKAAADCSSTEDFVFWVCWV